MKKNLIALAVVLMTSTAFAQTTKPSKETVLQVPAALRLALQGGLKVEKQFQAEGGLVGWVLSQGPGQNMVVYTSADGQVALSGTMVNAKGENLTQEYLEKHAPKVDYQKAWEKLDDSHYVAEGAKGSDVKSVIYAFKDANCSFCHLAWKAFLPYQKVGLQVRWIPVAFLRADSYTKGAAILEASSPEAELINQQTNYGKAYRIPATTEVGRAKVEQNNKLMQSLGFNGTPAVLYKDASGKVLTINGMPRLARIPAMTGLPLQENNDPDLAKY